VSDPTEAKRREMVQLINSNPQPREKIEEHFGQVWDTNELQEEFTVQGFKAPFVVAIRKSDSREGSLMFQHNPRLYFAFEPHEG
jgi:hypothetical protein